MQPNDLLKALFKFVDIDLQANRAGKYSNLQRYVRYKFLFGLWAFFQVRRVRYGSFSDDIRHKNAGHSGIP